MSQTRRSPLGITRSGHRGDAHTQTSARGGRGERAERVGAQRARAVAQRGPSTPDRARHPGKGYGLVRRQGRQDVHRVYELVNANQADACVLLRTMCRVLKVSASGYYGWLDRGPSRRAIDNAVLVERFEAIHAESDGTYGMPGFAPSCVIRAMSTQGALGLGQSQARGPTDAPIAFRGVSRRRGFIVTTERDQRSARRPTWSSASSWPTARTSCGWPT